MHTHNSSDTVSEPTRPTSEAAPNNDKLCRIAQAIGKLGERTPLDVIRSIQGILLEPTNPLVNEIKDRLHEISKDAFEKISDSMPMSKTGARRSKLMADEVRFDLLDSNDAAMRRLAKVFALGFKKYGPDNWKKGFPNSEYYQHAREHMLKWVIGAKSDEDDLAHAVWNLCAIMWNEENLPEMCDFPLQQKH